MSYCFAPNFSVGRTLEFYINIRTKRILKIYAILCFLNVTGQDKVILRPDERTTHGEIYVRRVVNGREFYSRPNILMFTAPARLCRGKKCDGHKSLVYKFPLYIGGGNAVIDGFSKYGDQKHKNSSRLPYPRRTTRATTTTTPCPTQGSTSTTYSSMTSTINSSTTSTVPPPIDTETSTVRPTTITRTSTVPPRIITETSTVPPISVDKLKCISFKGKCIPRPRKSKIPTKSPQRRNYESLYEYYDEKIDDSKRFWPYDY